MGPLQVSFDITDAPASSAIFLKIVSGELMFATMELSMSTNLVPCTSLFVYRKSGSRVGLWSIAARSEDPRPFGV